MPSPFFSSSHVLFNLFPFGFYSTKNYPVQVPGDIQFSNLYGCFSFFTLSVFSASLNKVNSFFYLNGFSDTIILLVNFLPFKLLLLSIFLLLLAFPALLQLLLLEYHWSWIGFLFLFSVYTL